MGARGAIFYVYGCAAVRPSLPRPATALETGTRCEWIEDGGLAVLVSPVPAADYEEAPLARHMDNLPWLTQRVERHHRVLLEAMAHAPVVPCRFGVLLRRRAGVVALLRRWRAPLLSSLERLGQSHEWSVKAFATVHPCSAGILPASGKRAGAVGGRCPDASGKTRTPTARAVTTGKAYLLGRARERTARREAADRARGRTGRIYTLIGRLSADVAPLPVRAVRGQDEPLLNLACLVRRKDTRRWLARLQSLREREERQGVRLAWSGPWPPYSFVGDLPGSGGAGVSPASATLAGRKPAAP